MANRRMFSLKIVDTDLFLDMSPTAQLLYFHLAMRGDDDGFVSNPKKITKLVSAADDDFKMLIAKEFVIPFKSGVIVIRHWKENNYIQNDRKHDTIYQEEMSQLGEDSNGVYHLTTKCIQDVSKMDTEDRLGKDRLGKANSSETEVSQESEVSPSRRSTTELPPPQVPLPPPPSFEIWLKTDHEKRDFTDNEGNSEDKWVKIGSSRPLSEGQMKTLKRQYNREFGIKTISPPKNERETVFEVWNGINPAYISWRRNTTQIEAVESLLDMLSVEQIAEIVKLAQFHAKDRFCPKIMSPWDMLNKIAALKSYLETKGRSDLSDAFN